MIFSPFRAGVFFGLLLIANFAARAAEPGDLDPNLEPLRPMLGRTFRGEFKNSTPEKPLIDVSRWERALNGKAVRMTHSVNGGTYGGEAIYRWDPTRGVIEYFYFTTAGFRTEGVLKISDGKWTTTEKVIGSAGGTTEVRGVAELKADGSFHVKTEMTRNGSTVPGHEVTYRADPAARVEFK